MTVLGEGDYTYEELEEWGELPEGWEFRDVVDVVVDRDDRVYVFNRGGHPVIVFEADGSFVTSWGDELFTRPHGLTLVDDAEGGQVLWCVDDMGHWVGKFSLQGELLHEIGTRDQGTRKRSGEPFNQPTKVAIDSQSGDLYVSDGYGNSRVHKYTAAGEHLFSWGDYGLESGQFNFPHSVCTDSAGRVYVADRENHRVQIFDREGQFLEKWDGLHRACGLHITDDVVYVGQIMTHLDVNMGNPNLGACVTLHDLQGRRLARLGDVLPGEGLGQFLAPHCISVDSRGDLYVGEVSYSAYINTVGARARMGPELAQTGQALKTSGLTT